MLGIGLRKRNTKRKEKKTMDEMLKKQDVLDAIYAKMEKTDKPDVVLGLAAAMSTVKQMQGTPVNPAEEQEPCTDAISRQAMHIELEKWITYGEYKYSNATKYLYDRIDRLPLVIPQPIRWIPVERALPEDGKRVMWCFTDGAIGIERYKCDAIDHFYPQQGQHGLEEAVAWMPLPEPYKASPTGAERSE
jgi:hypothetical protein